MRFISFSAIVCLLGAILFLVPSHFTDPVVTLGVAYSVAPESVIPEGRMVSAIKAYVDWHNGKDEGFRFRLVLERYLDDPSEAISSLRKKGAQVVVGFPFSQQAIAARDSAEKLKIPVLSTVASTTELSGLDDWFFRVKEDFDQETSLMASLMDSLGLESVVGVWSGNNYPYAVGSVKEVVSKSDAAFTGLFHFPKDCSFLDEYSFEVPDGVLIYADPSVSYWAVQYVTSLWPQSVIFVSRWSLLENHHLTNIAGLEFYYTEAFNPTEKVHGDFADYWRSVTSQDFSLMVRYGYCAMEYLSSVFREGPSLSGQSLRSVMSKPREIRSLGWTVRTDKFGDVVSDSRVYLLKDAAFREVSP